MNRDPIRRDNPLRRAAGFKVVCALAGFSGLAGAAEPQRPTPGQIAAIRQACRADYRAHCIGVPTGGAAALACLRRNAARVSPACQRALGALGNTPDSGWMPSARLIPVAATASRAEFDERASFLNGHPPPVLPQKKPI